MTFSGKHRSLELAERRRRELEREHNASFVIVARRNGKGRYSNRGHYFVFEGQPKGMFRTTVAISYPLRKKYRSFKITRWTRQPLAQDAINQMGKRAVEGLEEVLGYKQADWWFRAPKFTNVESERVPLDIKLLDTERAEDEGA